MSDPTKGVYVWGDRIVVRCGSRRFETEIRPVLEAKGHKIESNILPVTSLGDMEFFTITSACGGFRGAFSVHMMHPPTTDLHLHSGNRPGFIEWLDAEVNQ